MTTDTHHLVGDDHEALTFAPLGGIGDIASTEPGSAARYNAGKPDLALVPLRLIALFRAHQLARSSCVSALSNLGSWQESGDVRLLWNVLSDLGDGWSECAQVFDYGRRKYAAWNWAKGFQWSVPLASAARHLVAMIDGEVNDPESGLPHRGHVYCNIVMLLTFQRTYPQGDDRPRLLAGEAGS